jgi:hypothetical protein
MGYKMKGFGGFKQSPIQNTRFEHSTPSNSPLYKKESLKSMVGGKGGSNLAKKQKHPVAWAIAGIATLLGIGGGVYYYSQKEDKNIKDRKKSKEHQVLDEKTMPAVLPGDSVVPAQTTTEGDSTVEVGPIESEFLSGKNYFQNVNPDAKNYGEITETERIDKNTLKVIK